MTNNNFYYCFCAWNKWDWVVLKIHVGMLILFRPWHTEWPPLSACLCLHPPTLPPWFYQAPLSGREPTFTSAVCWISKKRGNQSNQMHWLSTTFPLKRQCACVCVCVMYFSHSGSVWVFKKRIFWSAVRRHLLRAEVKPTVELSSEWSA